MRHSRTHCPRSPRINQGSNRERRIRSSRISYGKHYVRIRSMRMLRRRPQSLSFSRSLLRMLHNTRLLPAGDRTMHLRRIYNERLLRKRNSRRAKQHRRSSQKMRRHILHGRSQLRPRISLPAGHNLSRYPLIRGNQISVPRESDSSAQPIRNKIQSGQATFTCPQQ